MILFLNRYSLLLVGGVLVIFECFLILTTDNGGDFWEHASVVNELAKHPLHPSNPVILTDIPHEFFSPYSLVAALFSRITKIDAILTLQYFFSFFNLGLLAFSFYRFCRYLFKEDRQIVGALSLLLILFFWGKEPIPWSGFYHILVLKNVLCYPSTFSMALSLLVLSMLAKRASEKYWTLENGLIILLNAIIILTHPTTAAQLFIGIVAITFCFSDFSFKDCVLRSSFLIIPAIGLALFWPYYSLPDLVFGQNEDFHNASKLLYKGILSKNWPFFLAIPGLFLMKKDKTVYFLSLYIGLMILAYLAGYLMKSYMLGRLISGIMMFSQFLMAYMVVKLTREHRPYANAYAWLLGLAFAGSVYRNKNFLERLLLLPSQKVHAQYHFLKEKVNTNDIVLSDKRTNRMIPAFSGKVIASSLPMYGITDLQERRNAVDSFFTKEVSDMKRQIILNRYHPQFILVDQAKINLDASTLAWLENKIGEIVYKKESLELIKIKHL